MKNLKQDEDIKRLESAPLAKRMKLARWADEQLVADTANTAVAAVNNNNSDGLSKPSMESADEPESRLGDAQLLMHFADKAIPPEADADHVISANNNNAGGLLDPAVGGIGHAEDEYREIATTWENLGQKDLTLSAALKGEAKKAVERGVLHLGERQEPPPKPPNLSKILDPEKKKLASNSFEKHKSDFDKKAARDKAVDAKNVTFQSLGDTFELALKPLVIQKHPNCSIYHGLRYKKAELDFTVFSNDKIIIYSAKMQQTQFSPKTDSNHWKTIRANWEKRERGELVAGPAIDEPPTSDPVVFNLSTATFKMSPDDFLTALVPGWKKELRQ